MSSWQSSFSDIGTSYVSPGSPKKRKRKASASPEAPTLGDNVETGQAIDIIFDHHDSPTLSSAGPSTSDAKLDYQQLRYAASISSIRQNSVTQNVARRQFLLRQQTSQSKFRFRASLIGHSSCVNALAFSRGDGRWLASAGDDCKIHVRDIVDDLYDDAATMPVLQLYGHTSNIFSLSWSAHNKYLFSAGNDSKVLYYDLEHSPIPLRNEFMRRPETRHPSLDGFMGGHQDSIPEVSAHPTNPHLVLSCDDAGLLKLLDVRLPRDRVAAARSDATAPFSSVQWNPNPSDGNTFAAATTSIVSGTTRLFDIRRCFSTDPSLPLSEADAVVNYHTLLMQNHNKRGLVYGAAQTNSVCFDPAGKLLASSLSLYPPTIYAVSDPDPLVTLESPVRQPNCPIDYKRMVGAPDSVPVAPQMLHSSCTVKHGSFGLENQTGTLHYAIGSDDFRAYIFEISPVAQLRAEREYINREAWIRESDQPHTNRFISHSSEKRQGRGPNKSPMRQRQSLPSDDDTDSDSDADWESEVAYCKGSAHRAERMVRPARITTPAFVLGNSRSILNTVQIHPTLPYIATAGIEQTVTIHSATPFDYENIRPHCWQTGFPNYMLEGDVASARPRLHFRNVAAIARALNAPQDTDDESLSEHSDDPQGEQEHGRGQGLGNAVLASTNYTVAAAVFAERRTSISSLDDETSRDAHESDVSVEADDEQDTGDGHDDDADTQPTQLDRASSNRVHHANRSDYGAQEPLDTPVPSSATRDPEAIAAAADAFVAEMRNDPMYAVSPPSSVPDFDQDVRGSNRRSPASDDRANGRTRSSSNSTTSSAFSDSSIEFPDAGVDAARLSSTPTTGQRESKNAANSAIEESDSDSSSSSGHKDLNESSSVADLDDDDGASSSRTDVDSTQKRMPNPRYEANRQWCLSRILHRHEQELDRIELFDELLRQEEGRCLTNDFRCLTPSPPPNVEPE